MIAPQGVDDVFVDMGEGNYLEGCPAKTVFRRHTLARRNENHKPARGGASFGRIPQLERRMKEMEQKLSSAEGRPKYLKEEVTADDIAEVVAARLAR